MDFLQEFYSCYERCIVGPKATSPNRSRTSQNTKSAAARSIVSDERSRFTLFPKLALDIRLMIWEKSLPGLRIITIFPKVGAVYDHKAPVADVMFAPNHRLSITETSRFCTRYIEPEKDDPIYVARARYELAFHRELSRPTYFDFTRDSIYLSSARLIYEFTNPEGWYAKHPNMKLKHLIVGVMWMGRHTGDCVVAIKEIKCLDSLTVTVDDHEPTYDGRYLTAKDKVDLFKAEWKKLNDWRKVEMKAALPKSISWVRLGEMKQLAESRINFRFVQGGRGAITVHVVDLRRRLRTVFLVGRTQLHNLPKQTECVT
ncbi:hypothetical protein DL98DRAFT_528292 [Cadophora sp. DSE1049]|nr:hypothetical protein DL98DRAFT_528292 [Cadophora sp. DSE1049]